MFNQLVSSYCSDLGSIAESLLFYDNVNIIVNEKTLIDLFKKVDPNIFIQFISEHKDKIKISYYESGVFQSMYMNQHAFGMGIKYEDQIDMNPFIPYLHKSLRLPNQRGTLNDRKATRQFLDMLNIECMDSRIVDEVITEINTEKYFENYCVNYLKSIGSISASSNFEFKLEKESFNTYSINTNFKKGIINGCTNPSYDLRSIVFRYVSNITSMIEASKYDADILNNNIDKNIINTRIKSLIDKSTYNNDSLDIFKQVTLRDARSIREAINSNERSFLEFIDLYEKSRKFKDWIVKLDPDVDLIREYHRKIYENTWADKTPNKTIRFVFFTGVGVVVDCFGMGGIGTALGVGLSVVDEFLIDKLIRGWKPNQFIDNDLKNFLNHY